MIFYFEIWMQDEAEAGQLFQDEHDEEFNAAERTDPRFLPVDGNSWSLKILPQK